MDADEPERETAASLPAPPETAALRPPAASEPDMEAPEVPTAPLSTACLRWVSPILRAALLGLCGATPGLLILSAALPHHHELAGYLALAAICLALLVNVARAWAAAALDPYLRAQLSGPLGLPPLARPPSRRGARGGGGARAPPTATLLRVDARSLALLLRPGDFTPEDYSELLRLDERAVASRFRGATVQEVSRLPTFPYRSSLAGGASAFCVVCMEAFCEREEVMSLPCLHLYHAQCIQPWLLNIKDACPVCQCSIVVDAQVEREGVAAVQ